MTKLLQRIVVGAGLAVAIFATATCGRQASIYYDGYYEVDPYCQDFPDDCFGDIGGGCDFDEDCYDGECCDKKECGAGLCSYRCSHDADCPGGMLCENDYCFFACSDDSDCGGGQKCKHDHSVCQYD